MVLIMFVEGEDKKSCAVGKLYLEKDSEKQGLDLLEVFKDFSISCKFPGAYKFIVDAKDVL